MKKHLIAAAVAAAVAVPATAQVTVYGVLDGGYGTYKSKAGSLSYKHTIAGGLDNGNGEGWINGSRLGFRGSEDLGGGLKANFVLELGIQYSNAADRTIADAAGDAYTTNGATAFFGNKRQTWFGISGGFGEVRIGNQDNIVKVQTDEFEVNGGPNSPYNFLAPGVVGRSANAIGYISPTFNGLQAQAMLDVGETATGSTSGKDNRATMFRVKYSQGPLQVGASRSEFKDVGYSGTGGILVNLPSTEGDVLSVNANSASIDKVTHEGYGARYNFGVAEAFYQNSKVKFSDSVATNVGDITSNVVGLAVPMGNVRLSAAYSKGDVQDGGTKTVEFDGYQLIGSYNLSKRTDMYAIVSQRKADTLSSTVDSTEKVTAIGLRHRF